MFETFYVAHHKGEISGIIANIKHIISSNDIKIIFPTRTHGNYIGSVSSVKKKHCFKVSRYHMLPLLRCTFLGNCNAGNTLCRGFAFFNNYAVLDTM